jgi:hypothetical protein
MSMSGAGRPRFLVLGAAASLLMLILIVLPVGGVVKSIALAPLILLLPGYALSLAMFGPGGLGRGERLVYALALSISAAALGGLVWQLFFDLGRFSWACLMLGTVLIASAVAQRRDLPRPSSHGRPARIGVPTAIAFFACLVMTVVAVTSAADGIEQQRAKIEFSSLWIVPHGPGGTGIEIGLWNHQAAVHTYLISVEQAGKPFWRWQGKLGPRKGKRVLIAADQIPGPGELQVTLFGDGAFYRRVELLRGDEG